MDGINSPIQFSHHNGLFGPTQHLDLIRHRARYLADQDTRALFWTEYRMVLTLIQQVGEALEPLRAPLGSPSLVGVPLTETHLILLWSDRLRLHCLRQWLLVSEVAWLDKLITRLRAGTTGDEVA
jgi:hypothetical protein